MTLEVTISFGTMLFIFGVNFLNIAGRAFQQLSVVHHKIKLVPPVSFLLGAMETILWGGAGLIAVKGTYVDMAIYALTLGASGSLGAIFSMIIHKRIRHE